MFETAMFCDLMQQFCHRAHQNSKDKGFWDEGEEKVEQNCLAGEDYSYTVKTRPINFGEKYMLMVSELCELFEAHRKGKLTAPCDKPCYVIDPTSAEPTRIRCEACNGTGQFRQDNCPTCAGQGLITTTGIRPLTNEEEEIADVLIRVADYCGYRNIDLGAVILSKMRYNATRPHMHNKSC
jgi:NTP pyrophosphatase (non-canonical NTP hydrolase)